MKVLEIHSGLQTGTDQGSLFGAEAIGIRTGGCAPKGYRTESGDRPDLGERFGLYEHTRYNYLPRTTENVQNTDVTVIVTTEAAAKSPGTEQTKAACVRLRKPFFHIYVPDFTWSWSMEGGRLICWLEDLDKDGLPHDIINFAGNRESVSPGIQEWTEKLVKFTFS